jgi:hypothetical protein
MATVQKQRIRIAGVLILHKCGAGEEWMLMGVICKTRALKCIQLYQVKMETHATTLVQLPAMKTKSFVIGE